MGITVSDKVRAARAVIRGPYTPEIDSDLGRWQARFFEQWVDHGILRHLWRNEGQIAPGLYRANHPDAAMLRRWKDRGIVEVISLRAPEGATYLLEAETCAALGLRLRSVNLAARKPPTARNLLLLLDIFDTLERPALIHCKSGADRTGLAAALWHIHIEGVPVAQARKALNLRHLHLKWSKTGVLDRFLDAYQVRLSRDQIPLRDWITTEYQPDSLRL
ncbi:tyrosine-protein phosphatase [Gymnodinialimonas sp. 2305UL16-5]|uniref:tyrosine-protein phosphatase n=1 Tax=Gymnodinialimonas mytili TaxID=3126503 RepID=UPI0030988A21